MNRNDRLFELIQLLRDGGLHTAGEMAGRYGVSVRTIWRDMAMLVQAGLPVQGERGVGYILRGPITLPPMILTPDEAEAMQMGLALVMEGKDARLVKAARNLTEKFAAVLPVDAADG